MESSDVAARSADDDPTSSLELERCPSTATPEGLADDAEKENDDLLKSLIERVAQLKASEPVPKVINEVHEVATQVAAKVAASPKGSISPETRQAFAELLTANSEFLHRKARRGK